MLLQKVDAEKLEEILTAYISMVREESDQDTIEVEVEVMRQMSLLAAQCLSRIIVERYS